MNKWVEQDKAKTFSSNNSILIILSQVIHQAHSGKNIYFDILFSNQHLYPLNQWWEEQRRW